MRKINRSRRPVPPALLSAECGAHLELLISDSGQTISDDFYRGLVVDAVGVKTFTVVVELKYLYNSKCAYCEKFAHAPKIDHHRPKGNVVGMPRTHRGYYWLSYEWSNLLPACTDCNAIGAKGSKFPVRGRRNLRHPVTGNPPLTDSTNFVYDSSFNTQEQPLILHPEYCNAMDHFGFEINGKIIGLSDEGTETIRALKLDNADLNGWRRAIYDQYNSWLLRIVLSRFRTSMAVSQEFFEFEILDWLKDMIGNAQDLKQEYTFFRSYILENLEKFFVEPLDIVYKPFVKAAIVKAIAGLT